MKIRKAFVVLSLFLAYTCNCFASSFEGNVEISSFLKTSKIIENKIYVAPGTVYIAPHQILLNVAGQLLPIGNLSADSVGVFVSLDDFFLTLKAKGKRWKCRCGRIHEMDERWCACGRDWTQGEVID